MGNRRSIAPRCPGCRLLESLCLCEHLAPLAVSTRVVLVLHHNEADKPTNTGRLACACLQDSELRVRGLRDARMSTDGIVRPERRTLLLYPHASAEVLSPELAARDPRPVTLVVPDATWNQAARIVRREPVLAALPRVMLPPVSGSALQVRANTREDGLSTAEAIASALGLLGEPAAEAHVRRVLSLFVRRTLWSRGALAGPRPELDDPA